MAKTKNKDPNIKFIFTSQIMHIIYLFLLIIKIRKQNGDARQKN